MKVDSIIIISAIFTIALFVVMNSPKEETSPIIRRINLSQPFINELNSRFSISQEEFAYCLEGYITNDTIIVSIWKNPEIINASSSEISIECGKESIGTIHSHKNRLCTLSPQDIYTFGKSKHKIIGVICSVDNIVFYTPESLIKSIEVIK